MRFQYATSGLLAALFSTTAAQLPSNIFHGSSIVLYPNTTSNWPGDSTFVAANFYCYFTSVGYLSFGWWLPAKPNADHSHCRPNSTTFDWFEYTTSVNCGSEGCKAHVVNYNPAAMASPAFEEDYVLAALDLGNGRMGELGLSYFNREGGGYAVGTRRVLSDASTPENADECRAALATLRDVRARYSIDLPAELEDLCSPAGSVHGQEAAQRPLDL